MSSVKRQGSVCRRCGNVNPSAIDTICRRCGGLVLCDVDQIPAIRNRRELIATFGVEAMVADVVRKLYLEASEKSFRLGIRKH